MEEKPKNEKKKTKLDKRAEMARIYLENTKELVDDIKENTNKQKLDERLNLIIDSDKLRNEQQLDEKDEASEKVQESNNKQKEISDSNNE